MIVNRDGLLLTAPIKNMATEKISLNGVSYGLSEAGYDIRIKQTIKFLCDDEGDRYSVRCSAEAGTEIFKDSPRFILASAIEEFQMPDDLVGIVHDKSTWARKGLSVFNTVIENGWNGFLTLELVYHGGGELIIPAGSGIAQVVFHRTTARANYNGKYQYQADMPVEAKESF